MAEPIAEFATADTALPAVPVAAAVVPVIISRLPFVCSAAPTPIRNKPCAIVNMFDARSTP